MKKILIIRMSAIGDIVMASPIVDAIKLTYPTAEISWLVQPHFAAPIINHPNIDHVIHWDHKEWSQLWQQKKFGELFTAIRAFKKLLREIQFDTVLDLQGLLKSGIPAWFTGASNRIGLGSKEGSQFLMHQVVQRDKGETQKIGSEYRYLAETIGLDTSHWKTQLHADNKATEQALQLIDQHVQHNAYIVICPFTTRPQKHWFNDFWIVLCENLIEQLDFSVIILGGPGDKATSLPIIQAVDSTRMINLTGETSLQVASEIIKKSTLLVGVDTGLTHMGHAHEIPTLALFGSTCPYLETDNPLGKVIYHDFDCSPCKRNPTCDGRFDCMRDITPNEVLTEAILLTSMSLRQA